MSKIIYSLPLFLFTVSIGVAQTEFLNEISDQSEFQNSRIDLPESLPAFTGNINDILDQAFDSLANLSEIKGISGAMLFPDGTLWTRSTGIRQEVPDTVVLQPEDLMGIGSITKTYLSTAILLLYEDGLLSLDDSIASYIDAYSNVPGHANIRQLLSHRTGINDYLNENPEVVNTWLSNPDSIWTLDSILHNNILEPNFDVGTAWSYSNTNYLLAGKIVENITGQSWQDFVRERIIDPMGLTRTFAYPESLEGQVLSNCWYDFDGDGEVEDMQGNGITMDGFFSFGSSAGCIISNTEDLVSFSQKLHGGSFLQPATLSEMHTDYRSDPQGFLYGLGAGAVPVFGLENWGHGGSIIYRSLAYHFPSEDMSLALQQNDRRVGPDYIDIFDIYLVLLDIYLNYSPPTSIGDTELFNKVDVFPNPAKDYLIIEMEENIVQRGTIEFYNPIGQSLLSETIGGGESKKTIDLSDISEGMYFLDVQVGQLRGIKKILITH